MMMIYLSNVTVLGAAGASVTERLKNGSSSASESELELKSDGTMMVEAWFWLDCWL
jgi:hypothetical protein